MRINITRKSLVRASGALYIITRVVYLCRRALRKPYIVARREHIGT